MARPIGGSHSQRPSQDTARNRPTAVATDASAGHSRSQKIVQRARASARASTASPACSARGGRCDVLRVGGPGPIGQVCLQQQRIWPIADINTQLDRR